MVSASTLAATVVALTYATTASAAELTFDWKLDMSGLPDTDPRFDTPLSATAGDTLVLTWSDPTTTPAGDMFHDVVLTTTEACTFEEGYTILPQTSVTDADGVKTLVQTTIALGSLYYLEESRSIKTAISIES
jgi:hypothetical protein